MTGDLGTLSRSQQLLRCLRSSWRTLATLALLVPHAALAELSATLPHTFHHGPPRGPAAMPGVDGSRAHRAESLPSPEQAQVLWERQLSAGLGANLVVDDRGSVFAVSPGRVTQFAADGSEEYARPAEVTSAIAVSLSASGDRLLLTREGKLLAWSPQGAPVFQRALAAPIAHAHAGLLALPRGGVLIHWGNALSRLGAGGELEGYAELKSEVVETLVDGDRIWLVGANGEVWTWNGRDPPARRGGFPSQVSAAALSAPGRLLAVVDGHDLVQWMAATGPSVTLAQVEELGGAPRISAPGGDSVYLLGSGGIPLSVPSGDPSATPSGSAPAATTVPDRASDRQRIPAGAGEVLASRDGSIAWLVPNTPLGLRRSTGKPHLFPEVQCHQPLSLVPAGGQRLVASCKSGEIWMIGPPASAGSPSTPEPSPRAPVR